MSTKRKARPKSRPIPWPEQFAPYGLEVALLADIAAFSAPPGASLPAVYLSVARTFINAAVSMQRDAVDAGGCAPPVITGGPRFTRTA